MKRFLGLFAFVVLIMSLSACKDRDNGVDNPFFEQEWTTQYGVPPFDRIEFSHYKPAFEQGMSVHNGRFPASLNRAKNHHSKTQFLHSTIRVRCSRE